MKNTVFFVDDDVDLLMQNKLYFEVKGHNVMEASSSEGAIEVLKKGKKPSIMVVDVHMENHLAGLNLAQYVAKNHADIPLIVLSGYSNKATWQGVENNTWNNVTRILEKPITPEKLESIVREVLK